MRFKKILLFGIREAQLDSEFWGRIDKLTDEKVFLAKDSSDIQKEITDTDCLLVGFGVEVNKDLLNKAPKLKYIAVLATAYGKIDASYAKEKGIVVCNIPGYSTESVAEFVIATILETLRDLETGKQRGRDGKYSEDGLKAKEIKGKKFGVIGLGNIGSRVAEIAQGFGAEVKYWSRNKKDAYEQKGIQFENIDTLLPSCDFVSINLAQTKETEQFFDQKKIDSLKSGSIIVNTAPMDLIDINALADRLAKNDITFILDHSDEMSEEDLKKLSQYKNCIIYPPMAYITDEARIAKQEIFVSSIEKFTEGSPINTVG